MQTYKIEGFNRGAFNALVVIDENYIPALYRKEKSEVIVNWGDCSDESMELGKIIITAFIKQEYCDSSSHIDILARKFTQNFISGWGEGNFSVVINIRTFFKKQGHEYFYEGYKRDQKVNV